MPGPTDLTKHDGKPIDWATHAALLEAEIRLGYRLTVVQGIGGAAASGGTHVKGRAVDLAPFDHARKVRVLRELGFAAWYRPELYQGGRRVWGAHVHAVLMTGNRDRIAQAALNQIQDYKNHRSGLVSNLPDRTWHPHPIVPYRWPGSDAALALEKKAAALLDKPDPAPVEKVTTGALRVDGVDLSHHNKVTAAGLAAAKKAGVRWVYHKATEGSTVKDGLYDDRRKLVAAAGLPFGAYHFARPTGGDALAEARYFLAYAKPGPGDMRPMLDLEDDGGLTRAQLTKWVGAFVTEVKARTGVAPLIYTPFDLDDDFGCMLWVARYSNSNATPRIPKPWSRWRIRQFSNGVYGKPSKVAGLGAVDLNTWDDSESLPHFQIPTRAAPKPDPTPKPIPAPPVVDEDGLTISVVVANIKSNPLMPQIEVLEDIATIRRLPTPGATPVWMGSEITPPRYKQAWADVLDCLTLCDDGECPITLRAIHWTVESAIVHTLHEGKDGVSPHRVLSVARTVPKVAPPVLKTAFLAKHALNGAWNDKYPETQAWRRENWLEYQAKTKATVNRLHDQGYTVVIGGDDNRVNVAPYHPAQIELVHHGIDHLDVIPAPGVTVTPVSKYVTAPGDLNTDHPALVGTFTLKETAA